MNQALSKSHQSRRRDRVLSGAPVALVLGLLLAACQSTPPSNGPQAQTEESILRVADDTRAGGDPQTAISLYRRAHEMAPKDPAPLGRLASTLAEVRAYDEAMATYRKALELAPNDVELHRGYASLLLSLDHAQQALDELQLALAKEPNDPRLLNTIGVAHDLIGRHDLAQKNYREALQLAPKNAGFRNNYGLSLAMSGDYITAINELSVITKDPGSPTRYRLNLALVYGLSGDDQKAAAVARTALDEQSVRSNVAYYITLRGMDEASRAAAIMGRQLHGTPVEQPPVAAAPDAAPREPVAAATLPTPATAAAAPASHARKAPAAVMAKAQAPDESAKPADNSAPLPPLPEAHETTAASQPVEPQSAATEPQPVAAAAEPMPAAPEAATAAAAPAPAPSDVPEATAAPVKLAKADPSSMPAAPAPAASDEPATAVTPEPAPAETAVAAAEPGSDPAHDNAAKAAPAAAGGFALQLGSFSSEGNARKLADQLNQKGYAVAVVHNRDRDGRDWYIVRAGGYATADEAGAAARHMREAEQVPAVVVHLRKANQA